LFCRGVIILVFAASVIAKVRNIQSYREFAAWVAILPIPLARVRVLPFCLIGVEGAIVVLTAIPWSSLAGLGLAGCCLGGMTVGTVVIMRKDANVSCWCFGPSRSPMGARHLVRDGILLAAAADGAMRTNWSSVSFADMAITIWAVLTGTTFLVFVDDLISLFHSESHTVLDGSALGVREEKGKL
jgi:hypothetical protein